MFDFAISQNQRRRSTRLVLVSRVLSVLVHFSALVILIEHPELLSSGWNHWLRQFPAFVTTSSTAPAPSSSGSRLVTNLIGNGPMQMPSEATLRANIYDFNQRGRGAMPPIQVAWGGLLAEGKNPETKPVMGKEEPKPKGNPSEDMATAAKSEPPAPTSSQPGAPGGGTPEGTRAGLGQVVPLPAPEPAPKPAPKNPEVTASTAPTAIPPAIPVTPPASKPPAPAPSAAKTDPKKLEQQVIQAEGSGLFDTRGFPLGEYANIVIERVKGNWSIPSNLRNSQGRTTVIFYIDKNGRFSDARIVVSSGSSSLDYAALSAVIGSNPFPPLPKNFPGDHVGAKFVFSYNERQ
jgi:periplasmic protein TonB